MSLREWLIAIGALIIIGVVLDGLRRMHRARKESMAISSSMGADDLSESPLEDGYNPELPNGGARPVGGGARKPDDLSSSDDEVTPETGWSATDDTAEGIVGQPRVVKPAGAGQNAGEQEPPVVTDVERDTARRNARKARPKPKSGPDKPARKAEPKPEKPSRPEPEPFSEPAAEPQPARPAKSDPPAGANRPEAKEVIVINVLAEPGAQFHGEALTKLFEACGLEYGDMDIYHRHEGTDTTTPVQFSVASAVEPGTFRPDETANLTTPGISFFMSLPGPSNAMQAFDFMFETAQCVVRNMGGELKDERRSVMTPQTVEHCRQRIREFERKQRFPRT
ncbi:cell division protein ZipA [Marinobacter persicus]|uniref:Cell division protein ZipA n=1 Tax=Marinobacter persicus TaxID=930118 RepID=A0A1I3WE89_9GAMM|nr:cell division protein ZipA [Marinobacter persicus]GHD47454.1 cell division protein ZipA [Marinobacter persicus]SFK05858.1 cell division protein ZipA [Marinobacter persicus]